MSMSHYKGNAKKSLSDYCYDYERQVWIIAGKYLDCGHPPDMQCTCYGRQHAGEVATITEHCH